MISLNMPKQQNLIQLALSAPNADAVHPGKNIHHLHCN